MKRKNYGNLAIENATALNTELITADDIISARTVNRPVINILENQETNYNLIQTLLKTIYGNTNGIVPDMYESFAPECFEVGSFKNNTSKYFLRIPTGFLFLKKQLEENLTNNNSNPFLKPGDYNYRDNLKKEQFSQDTFNSFLIENKPEINIAERQLADFIGLDLTDLTNDIKIYQDLIPMAIKVAIVNEDGYTKYDASGSPMYVTDSNSNVVYLAEEGKGNLKIRYGENTDAEITDTIYNTTYNSVTNSETPKLNNETIRQSVVFRDNIKTVDVGEGNGEYTSDISKAKILKDANGNYKYKTGYYLHAVRATSGSDEDVYIPNIKKNTHWEVFLPAIYFGAENVNLKITLENNGEELESFETDIAGDIDIISANNTVFNLISTNSRYLKANKIQKDKESSPVNGNSLEFISDNSYYNTSKLTISYTAYYSDNSVNRDYFVDYITNQPINQISPKTAENQKYYENIFELTNGFLGYFNSSLSNNTQNIYNYLNLETILQISNAGNYYLYYDFNNNADNNINSKYDKTGRFFITQVENNNDNYFKLFEITIKKNTILPYNLIVSDVKSYIDVLDRRLLSTKRAELNSLLSTTRTELNNYVHIKDDDGNREFEITEKFSNSNNEQTRLTSPITRIVDKKDTLSNSSEIADDWVDTYNGDTPSDFYEKPYEVLDTTKSSSDNNFRRYIYNRDSNNKGIIVNKNKGIRIFNNDSEELSEKYSYSKFKPIEIVSKLGNINVINTDNDDGRINLINLKDSFKNIIDFKGKTRIRSKNNDQLVIRKIGTVNDISNKANIKFVLGNSFSKDDEDNVGNNLVLGNISYNSGTTGSSSDNVVENNRILTVQLANKNTLRDAFKIRNTSNGTEDKITFSSYANIVPANKKAILGFPKQSRSYTNGEYKSEALSDVSAFVNENGTSKEFIENEDRWLAAFIYKGYFGKIVLADRESDVINDDARNGALNAGNSNIFNISSIYINNKNDGTNKNSGTINFDNDLTENTIYSRFKENSYKGISLILNRELQKNPNTDTESEDEKNFCVLSATNLGTEIAKNLYLRRQAFINNHKNSSAWDNSSLVVKGQSVTNTLVIGGIDADFLSENTIDNTSATTITRDKSDSYKKYNTEFFASKPVKNAAGNYVDDYKDDCLYTLFNNGRSLFNGDITLDENKKFTENTTFNKAVKIKNYNYANCRYNERNDNTSCSSTDERYVDRSGLVNNSYDNDSTKLARNNVSLDVLSGRILFGSDTLENEEDSSDLFLYGTQWIKRRLEIGTDVSSLLNSTMSDTISIIEENDNRNSKVSPSFYIKGASQFNGDVVFGAPIEKEENITYLTNKKPQNVGSKIIFWGKNKNSLSDNWNSDFDFHGKTWFDNKVRIGIFGSDHRKDDSFGTEQGSLEIIGNSDSKSLSLYGKFIFQKTGASEISGKSLKITEKISDNKTSSININKDDVSSIILEANDTSGTDANSTITLKTKTSSKESKIVLSNGSDGDKITLSSSNVEITGSSTVKLNNIFEISGSSKNNGVLNTEGAFTHDGNLTVNDDATIKNNLKVNKSAKIKENLYAENIKAAKIEAEELKVSGNLAKSLFDKLYPIGSIYITTQKGFDPNTKFGGTWKKIENRFLWCSDTSKTGGSTGGNSTFTIGTNNLPDHTHNLTDLSGTIGGGGEHSHGLSLNNGSIAGYENNTVMRSNGNQGWQSMSASFTGGSHTHTLTNLTGKISKSGGVPTPDPISLMPPYYAVFAWEKTGNSSDTDTFDVFNDEDTL